MAAPRCGRHPAGSPRILARSLLLICVVALAAGIVTAARGADGGSASGAGPSGSDSSAVFLPRMRELAAGNTRVNT
jgi:hypothetical protein